MAGGLPMRVPSYLAASILLVGAAVASAKAVHFVVELENSKGLRAGDAIVSEGKTIGEIAEVGLGNKDLVDVRIEIDDDHRDEIRKGSTFVVTEAAFGKRPSLEHYVLDATSPPAAAGTRFKGARSLADVWLSRGRVSAEDLNKALAQGVDVLRRNLDELKRSEQWAKLKDQVAQLSARLTVTGAEIATLMNEELPKLQQELDSLYQQYMLEMERQQAERTPAK
jgi:ABC-type transporter Mla subunit MlaD